MTLKNFLYQNCNISYRIYGQGKPLMLLHGFGENSSIWQKQADALKNNYLIITPDLPGSGKSAFWQKENFQFLQAQYIQQLNTDNITPHFNSVRISAFKKHRFC